MGIFQQTRALVKKIPKGKVTSYGAIAKALRTRDARLVGWAMYGNTDLSIPCHRVIKSNGSLAEKYSAGGWQEQKRRLEVEDVRFIDERHVDLKRHFWQPK